MGLPNIEIVRFRGNEHLYFYAVLFIHVLTMILISFCIERNQFTNLFFAYSSCFLSYILLTSQRFVSRYQNQLKIYFGLIVLMLIVAFPFWSDDVYRFIWDGKLWHEGIHPLSIKPYLLAEFHPKLAASEVLANLLGLMNSPNYHTVYPPICQLIFWTSTAIFPYSLLGQTLLLKLFFAGFILGIAFFLTKLIDKENHRVIYIILFNPLFLFEFLGNLHFEAAMLFFLLGSLYFISKQHILYAAIFFSGAVLTKILPLILLPSIFIYLGYRNGTKYILTVLILTLIGFLAFVEINYVMNFYESLQLYFNKFEFNASIYYVVRAIGYEIKGYNIIESYSHYGPIIVSSIIILISLLKMENNIPSLVEKWFWIFMIYYAFATTVHPWYILPIFVFGALVNKKTGFVWTFVIILSYHAYSTEIVKEQQLIILIEYLIIYIVLIFDLLQSLQSQKTNNIGRQVL